MTNPFSVDQLKIDVEKPQGEKSGQEDLYFYVPNILTYHIHTISNTHHIHGIPALCIVQDSLDLLSSSSVVGTGYKNSFTNNGLQTTKHKEKKDAHH